jgi:hypothetical protein
VRQLTTLNRYLIEKLKLERDFEPVLLLTISVRLGEYTLCSDFVVQPFWHKLKQRTFINVSSTAVDGQTY